MSKGIFDAAELPWAKKMAAIAATAALVVAGAAGAGLNANAAEDDSVAASEQAAANEAMAAPVPSGGLSEEAAEAEGAETAVLESDGEAGIGAQQELMPAAVEPQLPQSEESPAAATASPQPIGDESGETRAPQLRESQTPAATQVPTAEASQAPEVTLSPQPGGNVQASAPAPVAQSAETEGTFMLKVVVEGGPASAATHDYKFVAVCQTPLGQTKYWTQDKVKGDGVPVGIGGSFPFGTRCLVEQSPDEAQFDDYAIDFPGVQSVVVEAGKTPVVVFTNKYSDQFGTIDVKKTVSGGPAGAASASYVIAMFCGDNSFNMTVKGDGVVVPGTRRIPAGSQCVVKEFFNNPIDGFLAVPPVPQTVTIEAGKATLVEFENTFTDQFGYVKMEKTVLGGPSTRARDFLVRLNCGDQYGIGRIEVGGVYEEIAVPAGTQCVLTEDEGDAQIPGYELTPPVAPTVTVKAGEHYILEVVNRYTYINPNPTVTPSPSSEPSVKASESAKPSAAPSTTPSSPAKAKGGKTTQLARTGSDAIVVGSIAAALLAGGVAMILVRRRRTE